jgi:hypothetical protein
MDEDKGGGWQKMNRPERDGASRRSAQNQERLGV